MTSKPTLDLAFVRDRIFLRQMLGIAGPVALQQLVTAGLNMIDVVLVGQLGDAAVAALGLSNQVFFLLILFLFGVTSGMAIFTAQFWGRRDADSVRQMLGLGLLTASAVAVMFSLAAVLAPDRVLGLYTRDPAVIALGSPYLRLAGLSYILVAVSTTYIAVLRSIDQVRLTVIASVSALVLKTGLGYVLIFGYFGAPRMGVTGAGVATLLAWTFELALLLALVYGLRTPLAVHPLQLFRFRFPRAFLAQVARTVAPAAANEVAWSLGITTYNAIYARISTEAIAAVNVSATIEELAFVAFFGLGSACAIMIGQRIGAGEKELAYEYARRFLILCVLAAALIGAVLIPLRGLMVQLYQLSPQGTDYVRLLMLIFALSAWVRVHNFILFVGVLRAGGDTRFALAMEMSTMWLVGVPAALIGGFVLRWPVYGVYALVVLEEAVKAVVIHLRYRSRRWIHDLVSSPGETSPPVPLASPPEAITLT